jgi:hypothetical protein
MTVHSTTATMPHDAQSKERAIETPPLGAASPFDVASTESPPFEAVHLEKTQTIRFGAPMERVFPMFTPEGERQWVPGWDPRYLPCERRDLARGTVFTTHLAGEYTLWIVARVDLDRHEVEYARTVPGSRTGLVRVRCSRQCQSKSGALAGTDVEVTYTLTALSEEGNALLRKLETGGFDAMMRHWEADVARALGTE